MFTVQEIVKATNGRLLSGNLYRKVKGISTDSRTVTRTDCFIALVGEHLNGHDFLEQVVKKGARVLLVSRRIKSLPDVSIIYVSDTTKALGLLANYHRRRFSIPVIAITGSAGKTTTKEMIAHVLSSKYKVLKNYKTENNHFGVPYTLLKLKNSHQAAVIEVGTNRFGDIPWLSCIVEPTIAVFTNIGESHLEGLVSKEGIFKEKFSLVDHMPKNGTVIFNDDDPILRRIRAKKLAIKKIGYAIKTKTDLQATAIKTVKKFYTQFSLSDKKYLVKSLGSHNVYNALAAIACAKKCRLGHQNIVKGLASFPFPSGRQEIRQIRKNIIINDSYNANPVSFRAAIDLLNSLDIPGKKILVCADMLELGRQTVKLHKDMGQVVGRSSVDMVFTIGQFAKHVAVEARKSNPSIGICQLPNIEELSQQLLKNVSPGDAVLVKGSRRMKMERAIEFLEKNL